MSPSESTPPLLEMRGITKTFPGVRALDNVRLTVYPGEVHSLMGENGAGKSTLMKILSGAYQADPGGEILIEGKPVVIDGPHASRELGVAVIYQELSLAPNLSVDENIHAGRELRKGGRRFGMVDRRAMERGCEDVLKRLGASFGPATQVGSLSIAERQLVEIARAVHSDARIIVMDEPTRRSPRPKQSAFSSSSTSCATKGSRSSTSATAWPKSMNSPTAFPCCATAATWARSCATRSTRKAS